MTSVERVVLDLATRFADGRLTTGKLLEADDEELHRMLTEVRGIGTVRAPPTDSVRHQLIDLFISLVDGYVISDMNATVM